MTTIDLIDYLRQFPPTTRVFLTEQDAADSDHEGDYIALSALAFDDEDDCGEGYNTLAESQERDRAAMPDVPGDFPVRELKPDDYAKDRVTCVECGRSWDDAIPTAYTPAPSARCPFEAFHGSEA